MSAPESIYSSFKWADVPHTQNANVNVHMIELWQVGCHCSSIVLTIQAAYLMNSFLGVLNEPLAVLYCDCSRGCKL